MNTDPVGYQAGGLSSYSNCPVNYYFVLFPVLVTVTLTEVVDECYCWKLVFKTKHIKRDYIYHIQLPETDNIVIVSIFAKKTCVTDLPKR